ncbi:MAG TPA: hypothetical protein DF383_14080, partial [Deltaproteobacteria bacterium]|nr:hypothetical protein [Deltaproteobacteria bacterium]
MIAIDTNVLIRYLVQDHLQQAKKAAQLIEQLETTRSLAFLSDIVLCEVVWVLQSCYQESRERIAEILE